MQKYWGQGTLKPSILPLAFSLTLNFPVPFGMDHFLFLQILDFFPTEMNKPADRTGEIHIIVGSPLFELINGHMAN
jgi:hypothetical protein